MKKSGNSPKGKRKPDDTATPENSPVDDMDPSIQAVFDAIDALPPDYLIKLKNLRVAVRAFNSYRSKVVQEAKYRMYHEGLPGKEKLKKEPEQKVYDERWERPETKDDGADVVVEDVLEDIKE